MATILMIETIISQYGFYLTNPIGNASYAIASDVPFYPVDKSNWNTHNAPHMSPHSELSSLPDDSLFRDILSDKIQVPKDIQKQLPLLPDNVQEARQQCTIQFIASILLVRMEDPKPLTAVELAHIATQFKMEFKSQHPADTAGDFEMIPSVEMHLVELRSRIGVRKQTDPQWEHTYQLIEQAGQMLKQLLDADENGELFAI